MDTLLVLPGIVLLAVGAYLFRSPPRVPWPAIGLAAFTAAVCFTVGGDSGQDLPGPDAATVTGGIVGFLTVVSAILALIPGDPERGRPSRIPVTTATVAIVLGGIGLVVSVVTA
jgi:crotonobetainyl-CoA:carnitine CoA-transferase CaiB-like acyl-CoA transferase